MAHRAVYEDDEELEHDRRSTVSSQYEVMQGGRGEGTVGRSGSGSLRMPVHDGSRRRRGDSRSRQEQRAEGYASMAGPRESRRDLSPVTVSRHDRPSRKEPPPPPPAEMYRHRRRPARRLPRRLRRPPMGPRESCSSERGGAGSAGGGELGVGGRDG